MTPVALQTTTNAPPQETAKAHATTGAAATATTSGNSTISGDDFLVLLVAQLKNQDPTQPTDAGQYVQQLVGVNSLQQLININTQLTSLGGTAKPTV